MANCEKGLARYVYRGYVHVVRYVGDTSADVLYIERRLTWSFKI